VALGAAPEFDVPDLPRDLTILDEQDLMILFSEYVAWQNFAATRQSEAEVDESRAEGAQRYAEAIVMMRAVKGEVTIKRAEMAADDDVAQARANVLTAYANRKAAQNVYANCERVVNLISRELSRRIASSPAERRNNRWNP